MLQSSSADEAQHDRTIALVERILDLHRQLPKAKTDLEKTAIECQIVATDMQINQLAYELYELTNEEIRIVEGEAK